FFTDAGNPSEIAKDPGQQARSAHAANGAQDGGGGFGIYSADDGQGDTGYQAGKQHRQQKGIVPFQYQGQQPAQDDKTHQNQGNQGFDSLEPGNYYHGENKNGDHYV